ncbi:MAG: sarcosine oxidase subunit gamma [Alphaproteobacteria bacterium]
MVEAYLRQSALAHLGLEGRGAATRGAAGVAMTERPHRGIVNLRLDPGNAEAMTAFEVAFGFALPTAANDTAGNADTIALWLGPDEWWLVVPGPEPQAGPELADKLRAALADHFAAVTEVGESRTCIRVSGPRARALLQKGCPLDLHPSSFGTGACAQSILAKAGVTLHLFADETVDQAGAEGPVFDIYVGRSFAEYLWAWLEDAGAEYGVAILA